MMTQMTSFSPMSTAGHDFVPVAEAPVRLKRVDERPLEFNGAELCFAMSFVPGAPFWFEVNVWRRSEGGFVSAVKLFYRDEDRLDSCRAWISSDFEEVMDRLEAFDPTRDLEPEATIFANMPLVELAAAALSLRAWAADARRQYAGLVGQILSELENG